MKITRRERFVWVNPEVQWSKKWLMLIFFFLLSPNTFLNDFFLLVLVLAVTNREAGSGRDTVEVGGKKMCWLT